MMQDEVVFGHVQGMFLRRAVCLFVCSAVVGCFLLVSGSDSGCSSTSTSRRWGVGCGE